MRALRSMLLKNVCLALWESIPLPLSSFCSSGSYLYPLTDHFPVTREVLLAVILSIGTKLATMLKAQAESVKEFTVSTSRHSVLA
jgi:hypothetical protein